MLLCTILLTENIYALDWYDCMLKSILLKVVDSIQEEMNNEQTQWNEQKKMMKCQIECESLLWFIYYLFLKLKDSEPRTHSYANQFACTYLKLIGHFPLSTYSFMYILNYTLLYYTIILKRKKKKNLNFSYFYTIY